MHKLAIVPLIIRAMPGVLMLGFCLQPGARAARAEDFLRRDAQGVELNGWPATSTWIELVDPSGRVVRKEMMRDRSSRYATSGSGPHTPGSEPTNAYPSQSPTSELCSGPLVLNVVLNGCGYREQMRSGCLAFSEPLTIITIRCQGRSLAPGSRSTRSYGQFRPLAGVVWRLPRPQFSAVGFEPAKVHIECKRDEEVDAEVVMRGSG